MKQYLALLALPLLAACGDAADESDDPPPPGSEQTSGALLDDTATPALPDAGLTDPAATNTAPPPVAGTDSPADPALPPTNQGAQYQDSVTEAPEAAP